ncbi:hypothetical protein [Microbacterium sp.]|uniref:hypothetical protein n=1 Tax=Microbacterium sp. TaxID=51671 RepID=UPI0039E4530D
MSGRDVTLAAEAIVGIVKADERRRIQVGRHAARDVTEWRVYRLDDGRTIVLEAVEK